MKRVLSLIVVVAALFTSFAVCADEAGFDVGSTGEKVVKLQTRLIRRGFLLMKSADGSYGNMTKNAVKAFEQQLAAAGYEIEPDGKADAEMLKYLSDDNLELAVPVPEYGSKGGMVAQMQLLLINLGVLDGEADGVFGEMTKKAIEKFQQAMFEGGIDGTNVTGALDEKTYDLILDVPQSVKSKLPGGYSPSDPLTLSAGNLYAESCILLNADTGDVVYEKNADERRSPASTTKIMTLLLAVENKKLNKQITIPEAAAKIPSDSSVVPVTVGEVMTFKDLLYGMMINSGNDAANSVAELVGGSVDDFVKMMNKRAAKLGMSDTRYENPHGYYDENHYTTARDMGTLAIHALKNEKFKTIASAKTYTMAATAKRGELVLKCAYDILNSSSSSYCPYAYGIKTGYTYKAGQCYVGAAEKDGENLIIVLLHSSLKRVHLWDDAKALYNYGFASLEQ